MADADVDPLLIAGGYCPDVRFLDAHTGEVKRTLTLQDYGHVNRLAVSSVRRHLAIAGNPHVRCYDLLTRTEALSSYQGHTNNVVATGFEVDGRWLYTGSEDGTIKVWDCRTQDCKLSYENHGMFEKVAIHSVDLHPNQVELIAGDNQGKVLVWDLTGNRVRRTLIPEEGVPIRSVSIAPDAKLVVCANHEGTCYVWQLSDEDPGDDALQKIHPLHKIDAHSAYILRCCFSPEAKYLATTSADNTTNIWRSHAEGFARCFTLTGHTKWVWDCAFTSDGQYLVTGSSDCTCKLWDIRSGEQRSEFTGFKRGVTALALVDAIDRAH